jgi:hypothetical protein
VTAVSAPSGVLLWGGRDVADIHNDGALLDVASGRWTRSPSEGAPLARMDAVGIADARQVQVLWGSGGAGLLADAFTLR